MKYISIRACTLFFLLLILDSAFAKNLIENDYEETVVSAPKIDTARRKTISKVDLEKHNYSSLFDIINNSSSANTFSINSGSSNYFSRGALLNQVMVLIDGVPTMDPSTPQGTFDASLIHSNFIESIEIIQGDLCTEYGAYGAGTVINIHTKNRGQAVGLGISHPQSQTLDGFLTHPFPRTAEGSLYEISLGTSNTSGVNPSMLLDSKKNYPFSKTFLQSKVNFILGEKPEEENKSTNSAESLSNWHGGLQFLNSFQNQNLGETTVDLNSFSSGSKSQILQFHLSNSKEENENAPSVSLSVSHSTFERNYDKKSESQSLYAFKESYLGTNDHLALKFHIPTSQIDGTLGLEEDLLNFKIETEIPVIGSQKASLNSSAMWGKFKFLEKTLSTGIRVQKTEQNSTVFYPELQYKFSDFTFYFSQSGLNPSLFQKLDSQYGNPDLKPQQTDSLQIQWTVQPDFNLLIYENDFKDFIIYDLTSNKYQNYHHTQTTGAELHLNSTLNTPLFTENENLKLILSYQESYNFNNSNATLSKTKLTQYPDIVLKSEYELISQSMAKTTSVIPEIVYQSKTEFSGTPVKDNIIANIRFSQNFKNSIWKWGGKITNLGHQKIQRSKTEWLQNTSVDLHTELEF